MAIIAMMGLRYQPLNCLFNAEEILGRYPSLQSADIYSVIAYYLRHRTEVDTYLKDREAFRVEVRLENESRFPSTGLREKLLARRRH